jgi:hypothetical protein
VSNSTARGGLLNTGIKNLLQHTFRDRVIQNRREL